jgi:probable phosphoglycerate mutase
MTTLIIVRHAETEANVSQIWQGSLDAPLTERGRLQVEATARHFAEYVQQNAVDAFYVSPLPRAQSTAAGIAEAIGLQPTIEPHLSEFNLGEWEGRTFADLRDTEDLWGKWAVDPRFAPPNGESPYTFRARAVAVMDEIAARHPGHTVLVVTHGGLIANVLAGWLDSEPDAWRKWEAHNCAITTIERNEEGWTALSVNDISHLPAETVKQPDYSIYE